MLRFSHDQILDEINKLFDWNPHPLSSAPPACPKVEPPSDFYYDHLDANLSLKRTIPMPSLVPNLSTAAGRVLDDIKQRDITLPPVVVGDQFPHAEYCKRTVYREPIVDAYSVGKAYQCTTADNCMIIASMLQLSPKCPTWESFFLWGRVERGTRDNPGLDGTFAHHINTLTGECQVPDAVWNSVEGDVLSLLRHIAEKSPILAPWEILPSYWPSPPITTNY